MEASNTKAEALKSSGGPGLKPTAYSQQPRGADLEPQYRDRALAADLAARHELYGLLVACTRNHGTRTAHAFGEGANLPPLVEIAQHYGFGAETGTNGVIVVWSAGTPKAETPKAESGKQQVVGGAHPTAESGKQ